MIRFYQRFISPLFGSKCRYYPSCSEFARLQFKHNGFFSALFRSVLRILRCNQLFAGGIDHPIVPCPKDKFFCRGFALARRARSSVAPSAQDLSASQALKFLGFAQDLRQDLSSGLAQPVEFRYFFIPCKGGCFLVKNLSFKVKINKSF